ncbi:hypothetical protein FF38_05548 [Lucilia cuprina]|uniref:Uncharacterized protein n=1 Tax=Lucilia cuprina TaxID=7375 RepID=A0A0L0C8A4_LUCCU|nr:hypothetical protein FF38_05548 [Lucilia cuprina]
MQKQQNSANRLVSVESATAPKDWKTKVYGLTRPVYPHIHPVSYTFITNSLPTPSPTVTHLWSFFYDSELIPKYRLHRPSGFKTKFRHPANFGFKAQEPQPTQQSRQSPSRQTGVTGSTLVDTAIAIHNDVTLMMDHSIDNNKAFFACLIHACYILCPNYFSASISILTMPALARLNIQ